MPIPDYESCMLPVLKSLGDGQIHSMKEVAKLVSDHFQLSDDERQELLPSGNQTYITNRVGWARTYMIKAGLVESPSWGKIRITTQGQSVLAQNPAAIDQTFLMSFPSFVEWRNASNKKKTDPGGTATDTESIAEETPDEAIESAYRDIRDALADDLLEQVMECSPAFFERLVIDLLRAMGYGGAIPDAGKHLGKSGDGGIDGIIHEDKLGLDTICIQAKRWRDTVGRPAVQGFAGSMEAYRARKGVMITTSSFSKDAYDFVDRIERKIVLIDGRQLAQLMIDYNIGVAPARTYTIKKIDSDYFIDESV